MDTAWNLRNIALSKEVRGKNQVCTVWIHYRKLKRSRLQFFVEYAKKAIVFLLFLNLGMGLPNLGVHSEHLWSRTLLICAVFYFGYILLSIKNLLSSSNKYRPHGSLGTQALREELWKELPFLQRKKNWESVVNWLHPVYDHLGNTASILIKPEVVTK